MRMSLLPLLLIVCAGQLAGAENRVHLRGMLVSFPAHYLIYRHDPAAAFGATLALVPTDADGRPREDKATLTYAAIDRSTSAGAGIIAAFQGAAAQPLSVDGWSIKQAITPYKDALALQVDALKNDDEHDSAYMLTIRRVVATEDAFMQRDDALLRAALGFAQAEAAEAD